ncbi:Lpg1974 family pore-forming outer membrane protein [Paragemmobacter aquarius]|nr:Lpg1974 family pore-forming outer membrane protein [Gemmobacter aquarius]
MSFNRVLAPTAAAAGAIGAAVFPGMALAQSTDSPLVLSFEGAVGTGDHANAYGEAKLGSGFDAFQDDVAFVGSVGLSRSINQDWDWSLSVSQLGYADNTVSGGGGSTSASWTSDVSRSDVAFSFGRDIALGSAKARLGLGLAYAKASAEKGLDVADLESGDFFRNNTNSDFQGIGPRVSFDVQSAPVSANGKLSVIGGVEVNLLAGQYEHSKGFEAYVDESPRQFDLAESAKGDMMTAGIKIGLQYDANENTSFRAGVRHDVTRMDQVQVTGPASIAPVSVEDGRTSFFVGMNVGF